MLWYSNGLDLYLALVLRFSMLSVDALSCTISKYPPILRCARCGCNSGMISDMTETLYGQSDEFSLLCDSLGALQTRSMRLWNTVSPRDRASASIRPQNAIATASAFNGRVADAIQHRSMSCLKKGSPTSIKDDEMLQLFSEPSMAQK